MDEKLAIEARKLRKEYGTKVAVRGLDLQVLQGEVFGFLGPNGAGKTTIFDMMEAMLTAKVRMASNNGFVW